jgi:Raf kinase inhibitor-like YbhB/YbcL family protein
MIALPMRTPGILVVTVLLFVLAAGCADEAAEPLPAGAAVLEVSSAAFENGSSVPTQYTCDGADLSPPVAWEGQPEETAEIVVIMDDPDAPSGLFTHWILYSVPPDAGGLSEGIPAGTELPDGSMQGVNSFGKTGYGGPCPPPGDPHGYRIRVYALDTGSGLDAGADRGTVTAAMEGHVLAAGELTGFYGR